jgi:hypothetical protein
MNGGASGEPSQHCQGGRIPHRKGMRTVHHVISLPFDGVVLCTAIFDGFAAYAQPKKNTFQELFFLT